MDALVREVAARGGTMTAGTAVRVAGRRTLSGAVGAGGLVRVARGVYAVPDAVPELAAAAALRGVVSHESAARLWLLEALNDPTHRHVTLPRHRSPVPVSGTQLHWADLDDHEVDGRVTAPLRTVLDCARTLPFVDALGIADSALRRELVAQPTLIGEAARLRGPGATRGARVLRLADGRAANPFESALRAIALDAGLDFVPQLEVRGRGFFARVDLGDPERRIAAEADSFAWHGSRKALDRDCRRYDELVRRGWLVLRFSWEQVRYDPDWVAAVLCDTVALRTAARVLAGSHWSA